MSVLATLAEAAPSVPVLLASGAAVLGAAVLRGITGFGFALAAAPLLGMVLPPAQGVAVVILIQVMIGLRDVAALRRSLDMPSLKRLSLGALIGTPAGVWLLARLDPAALRIAIAATVAIGLALLLRAPAAAPEAPPPEDHREAFPAGLAAGLFGGLAAMAGPPAVAYFLRRRTAPATARASLMCFFFATSLMALPGMGLAGLVDLPTVVLSVLCLPLMLGGAWFGGRIFARTSESGYRKLAIAVLAVMAAASALRGIAGLMG
ncbi:MAG: hypothetical protein CML43_17820 [Rhodobacteraceae bacterium]|nr:hypothetical protein [Paracoccaceae bacterium]